MSETRRPAPAPIGLTGRHPSTLALLRWFEYAHLRDERLRVVSAMFHDVAHELVRRLPDSAELTTALRKLIEGKDAAVRAAVEALEQEQE